MANYVLSYAFSDQLLLTYARAAVVALRDKVAEVAGRIATRNARERHTRVIYKDLRSLDKRGLRDIGLA